MVKRALLVFLAATTLASSAWPADAPRIKVVASLPNFGSIAGAIGGDRVEVTTIASGAQDAHFVDPKPSFMVKLRNADLLLVNGLDLEIGWIPPLTQGARTARIMAGGPGYVDCSAGIPVVELPTSLSRAEGDVHPYGNPHYLADPLNAEIVASTIADALKKADPASADRYEARRKEFVAKLHTALFGAQLVDLVGGARLSREALAGTLDAFLDGTNLSGAPLRAKVGGWLLKMAQARGMTIVTYHRDYSYFAARFGIRVVDFVEAKPGIQPSAKHIEELTARLKQGDIRVLITRPFVEHRSTDALAAKTGVKILTLPLEVGGSPEATDYFSLIDSVTDAIIRALREAPDPSVR